jgi:hypothetical protein
MTPTRLRFGPADHGRAVTPDELQAGQYLEGFNYEVIDGRIAVSVRPSLRECVLEAWLCERLEQYADMNADVLRWVAT